MKKSLILLGPSAVGKNTLMDIFMNRNLFYKEASSYHTRPYRKGDKDNYISLSQKKFDKMQSNGDFYAISSFLGWKYGMLKSEIESTKKNGEQLIMDYSLDNLHLLNELKNDVNAKCVYLLPPNKKVLLERLNQRTSPDEVVARYRKARNELSNRKSHPNWNLIDYEIVNDNLNDTLIKLERIIL